MVYCSGAGHSTLPDARRRSHAGSFVLRASRLLALVLAPVVLVSAAWADTAAALPGWSVLSTPLPRSARPFAAGVFGDAGVAVAGRGGAVAVSTDAGRTWTRVSAAALTSSTLRGVAFGDAGHGVVVGDHATILVGAQDAHGVFGWKVPAVPGGVTADLRGVVLQGTVGYAVGTGGLVLETVDGGTSWQRESVATGADLNAVAMSADGQIVAAVGDHGTVVIKAAGVWTAASTSTSADLLDVALPADSARNVVYCCSRDRVFSLRGAGALEPLLAQPSLPAGGAMRELAVVESGAKARLVVGGAGGWLAGRATSGRAWVRQTGGAHSSVTSLAAGGGVCYATTAAGRLERTLSGGAGYALVLATTPRAKDPRYKAIVTAGGHVTLSGSTTLLAPGALLLQARPAGGTVWQTVASGAPGARTLSQSETPAGITFYRLRLSFAGRVAATGTKVAVGVRRQVLPSSTAYRVRLHEVFRVRGSVAPTAPRGRFVEVWTDRAGDQRLGPWHRIDVGWMARLAEGSTFVTRAFGTPVRETYHLKIRMPGDDRYVAGWSPRITVTVR